MREFKIGTACYKEANGWAEDAAERLRIAALEPNRRSPGTSVTVYTTERRLVTVAFTWEEIAKQNDTQLAELIRVRIQSRAEHA